jgi:hypothetical protein
MSKQRNNAESADIATTTAGATKHLQIAQNYPR